MPGAKLITCLFASLLCHTAFCQLPITDLTEQERYLLIFLSVFHGVSPEEDWDAYLQEYEALHPAPDYIQPRTGQASEIGILFMQRDRPKLDLLAPHFPIQYLFKFYPDEHYKVNPQNPQFAFANQFDIRKTRLSSSPSWKIITAFCKN